MIEKEYKVLLNQISYEKLCRDIEWMEILTQTNYYYVPKSHIVNEATIRIRHKKDTNILQIKIPVSSDKALHINKEFEMIIGEIPEVLSSNIIYDICGEVMGDLYRIGHLETERRIFMYDSDIILCLDKNKYLNIIDYELEVEYKNIIPNDLYCFLSKYGITFEKKVNGKFSRFMNQYNSN